VIYLAVISLVESKQFMEQVEAHESVFLSISSLLEKLISIGNNKCSLSIDETEKRKIISSHQSMLSALLSIEG
jgi:hypothetical protein